MSQYFYSQLGADVGMKLPGTIWMSTTNAGGQQSTPQGVMLPTPTPTPAPVIDPNTGVPVAPTKSYLPYLLLAGAGVGIWWFFIRGKKATPAAVAPSVP